MSFKSYFTLFFLIILSVTAISEIKAFAEIASEIDKCRERTYYTNADNGIYSANDANAMRADESKNISMLCGCIKFSEIYKSGNCLIMRDGNRTLSISVRYSSPVFYHYSCSPKRINYTERECTDKARNLVSVIIPDEITGTGMPEILDASGEYCIETVRLYFPGDINKTVTVKIRRDTCKPIYFDARRFYADI